MEWSSILSYFHWLLEQYRKLASNFSKYPFKIVNIEYSKKHDAYLLVVQVENSKCSFKRRARDIFNDENLLNGFSQKDVKLITSLYYEELRQPKFDIISQIRQNGKNVFLIQEKGKEGFLVKIANEISTDKEMIQNLDSEQAHLVGFITGAESNNKNLEHISDPIRSKIKS